MTVTPVSDPCVGNLATPVNSGYFIKGLISNLPFYRQGISPNFRGLETGAAFGYDAVAVADHVATGATGSDMHYQPGDIRPNFGDSALDTAAIISVDGAAVTLDFDGDYPAESTERVQALNATIMSSEIYNDYVTDSTIGATTDWLLTFPTKAFHVNADAPVEPFSKLWSGQSACEPTELSAVDREESTPPPPPEAGSSGPDFSPAPPADPVDPPKGDDVPLCYEATIVQFATESAAGTSSVAIGVNEYLDAADGWATLFKCYLAGQVA